MCALTLPKFCRQGPLVTSQLGEHWSNHMQMPTPLQNEDGSLRMFYTARDHNNQSHVFAVDFEGKPPFKVIKAVQQPVLSPGKLGHFDQAGVMPTAIIRHSGAIWMYYIGWSIRQDVPYHNAIGLAKSTDGGISFQRFLQGPIVGTSLTEPFFCGTADVFKLGPRWSMVYMSATEWRVLDGKPEPRYHLKQAFSDDGIHWDLSAPAATRIAIDYLNDDEGGVARASVFPLPDGGYGMVFCFRGLFDYRGSGRNAYRLGIASSADGINWQRHIGESPFLPNLPNIKGFDTQMECYPCVIYHEDETRFSLFYNGNSFGQTGIGFATSQSGAAALEVAADIQASC